MGRSRKQISAEELQRRSLSKEARTLATRIENVAVSLADHEARIAELEAMFSSPDLFDEPAQIAASGEEYRVLKEEAQSLLGEWERLSLEAENIDGQLTALTDWLDPCQGVDARRNARRYAHYPSLNPHGATYGAARPGCGWACSTSTSYPSVASDRPSVSVSSASKRGAGRTWPPSTGSVPEKTTVPAPGVRAYEAEQLFGPDELRERSILVVRELATLVDPAPQAQFIPAGQAVRRGATLPCSPLAGRPAWTSR